MPSTLTTEQEEISRKARKEALKKFLKEFRKKGIEELLKKAKKNGDNRDDSQ